VQNEELNTLLMRSGSGKGADGVRLEAALGLVGSRPPPAKTFLGSCRLAKPFPSFSPSRLHGPRSIILLSYSLALHQIAQGSHPTGTNPPGMHQFKPTSSRHVDHRAGSRPPLHWWVESFLLAWNNLLPPHSFFLVCRVNRKARLPSCLVCPRAQILSDSLRLSLRLEPSIGLFEPISGPFSSCLGPFSGAFYNNF